MSNQELPMVTVITPTFNQADFLRETIESVLSQDYPNIEYIIINDGSTDQTETILKEYDGKVRWETHQNIGQTPTINKGWSKTKGSIITWLNSDDTFLPGAVSAGVDYLLKHPETGIVFADSLFTEADGTPLHTTKPAPGFTHLNFVKECQNPISQPSAFIRREIVDKVGDLDPHYYYFMDWDFWLRAGIYYKIDYTPGVWSTYRLHADSKTVSQSKRAAPELEYMYDKFFRREDLSPEILKSKKQALMNMCFTCGGYFLRGNDNVSASRKAKEAFRHNPAGIFSLRNLHKFFYCYAGNSSLYRKLKKISGR